MDLGATLCVRSRPLCAACPLETDCAARRDGAQAELPAPRPRRSVPRRRTAFLVLRDRDGSLLLERRPPSGIWGGLWCFPECGPGADIEAACRSRFGVRPSGVTALAPIAHGFTHFLLDVHPFLVEVGGDCGSAVADSGERRWYPPGAAASLGLAAPGETPDRATRGRVSTGVLSGVRSLEGTGEAFRRTSDAACRTSPPPRRFQSIHPRAMRDNGAPETRYREAARMARTVQCVEVGRGGGRPRFSASAGRSRQARYSRACRSRPWQQWLAHQTMLINENRLKVTDPEARRFLEAELEQYFFGKGSAAPEGYVPPQE